MDKSYNDLFGLEMIVDVDDLKCEGQYPRLMQALAMLIIEIKQSLSLIIHFMIFYKILSGLEADELLYLLMAFLNTTVAWTIG